MQCSENALNKHHHKIPFAVSYESVLSYDLTVHCGSWMRQKGKKKKWISKAFSLHVRGIKKKKSLLGFTAVLQNTTVARKADNTAVSSLRYGRGWEGSKYYSVSETTAATAEDLWTTVNSVLIPSWLCKCWHTKSHGLSDYCQNPPHTHTLSGLYPDRGSLPHAVKKHLLRHLIKTRHYSGQCEQQHWDLWMSTLVSQPLQARAGVLPSIGFHTKADAKDHSFFHDINTEQQH